MDRLKVISARPERCMSKENRLDLFSCFVIRIGKCVGAKYGRLRRVSVALAIAATCAPLNGATAQTPQAPAFFQGKVMTLINGDAGGGLYDLVSRVVAQFLPRYIPGSPSIIVQGMPGASQVRAATYVQNVAAPDGLTLGLVQPYVILNKILDPSAKYDPKRLTWIARVAPLSQIGFAMSRTGVTSLDALKERTLNVGATGATGPAAMSPWAIDRMTGAKIRVIMGYTDNAAMFHALVQGELDGMGSADYSFIRHQPGWAEGKLFNPLYSISLRRLSQFPDTPAIVELAGGEEQRDVLMLLGTIPTVGVTIMAPPDVPVDRVAILRSAAEKMTADPEFREQMDVLNMDVSPMSGEAVADLVQKAMSVQQKTIDAVVRYTSPME